MTEPGCVSRERLERYVLGDLSDEDSQAIAVHVEVCDRCEETIAQFDRAEDTLVKALREPAVAHAEPPAYRLAARRAKSQPLPAPANGQHELADQRVSATNPCLRDYELLEPIARGGMGTVYRAVHQRLRRQVAVKVLPPRCLASPHSVARFQREMQAVGQLHHPAIVQATDGGEVDGVHFLVMELVEGIDLNSLVRCIGPLTSADACELARRTAIGLAHAHEQGVIHRDVKPSNVMLTKDGDIKILDLGLARIVGEQMVCDELTTVGQLMGTVDYMAPEQFENSHQADERCDVYGLGATLYKLLAGHAPYSGAHRDSPLVKLRRISAEPPPPLSTKRGELPSDLCAFVDRMLARLAADRPATMNEVAAGLEAWCVGHRLRELAREGLAKRQVAQHQQEAVGSNSAVALHENEPAVASKPSEKESVIAEPRRQNGELRHGLLRPWIVALILLSVLAALGVLITVQTSGGQLVIETSVPDVEVRIVRAGQPFKTLTVTQQPNLLRLGAGEYEVQLVGPADELQIENNKFTLTRGQTVVARVVHTPAPAPVLAAAVNVEAPASQLPQPRYDGKTTADWIAVLLEDRSPSRVMAAFDALQKLGLDQEKPDEAIKAVFLASRFHTKAAGIPSAEAGSPSRTVWKNAALTLGSFNATSVVNHGSALLDDPAYRPKLFVTYLLANDSERYRSLLSERLRSQLIQLAGQGPAEEQTAAIQALAQLEGESSPQFLAQCRAWLSASDEPLRLHAAVRLVAANQLPEEVLNVLRQLLKSERLVTRVSAVTMLGEMGVEAKAAVPDLIAIVEATDQPADHVMIFTMITAKSGSYFRGNLQIQAINSLGKIGELSAVPALVREWRRRVDASSSNKQARDASSRNFNIESSRSLQAAIESLTGLKCSNDVDGNRWYFDGAGLAQACSLFLSATAASPQNQQSRDAISRFLVVSSESDVEQAIAAAISGSSYRLLNPATLEIIVNATRLQELLELVRPTLPRVNVYRAMFRVIVNLPKHSPRRVNQGPITVDESTGIPRSDERLQAGLRFTQEYLKTRAAESPEARNQIFDELAAAIELPGESYELALYVDTLVVLGVPDADRTKRITAALEKANDPEVPWKKAVVKRGIEHLRTPPEASKPPANP